MSQTKAELIEPQGNVAFDTNTLYVDASNNRVGIGTTSPSNVLHIASSSPIIRLQDTDGGRAMVSCPDGNLDLEADADQVVASSRISFRVDDSERARIDSSGRLLVGTSSSLSANRTFQVAGTGGEFLSASATAGDLVPLILSRTRGTIGSPTVVSSGDGIGSLTYKGYDGTNYIDAAGIKAEVDGTPGTNDMPGRLVFSTTADGASSPTERMRLSKEGQFFVFSSGEAAFIQSALAAGTTDNLIYGRHSASATTGTGTTSFIVRTNGNVLNTNNSYGAISDIKLKENIVDASSQWSDIKALQVRNYNFKEGQTHTQIGLVAQEVELVSPGLVSESPDRDEDGNDLGTTTKSVNYSVLYMKAVKALQEAMERIEQLEAEMAAVKAQLS